MALSLRTSDHRLRAGWRILGFLIVFYALAIPASLAVLAAIPRLALEPAAAGALKGTVVALVATIAVLLARRHLDHQSFVSLGLAPSRPFADLLFGFGVSAVIVAAAIGVQVALGWATVQSGGATTGQAFLVFVGSAATIAWWEELVFRGYVLQNLIEGLGRPSAVTTSVILTGLFHVANPHATVTSTLIIAAIGYMHIVAYLLTRQLWLTLGLHAGWNFAQGGLFGLPVSGRPSASVLSTSLTGPSWASGGPFGLEASLPGLIYPVLAIAASYLWSRRGSATLRERGI